jgi:hypothetical protein
MHAYKTYLVSSVPTSRPNLDPDASDDVGEEGEEIDATNEDDSAMMAMMGLTGFGTTKVQSSAFLMRSDTL